jgi:hypothetical protein
MPELVAGTACSEIIVANLEEVVGPRRFVSCLLSGSVPLLAVRGTALIFHRERAVANEYRAYDESCHYSQLGD